MEKFDRDKAVEVAKKAMRNYVNKITVLGFQAKVEQEHSFSELENEIAEELACAIYLEVVKPAIEFWKSRLGSEIQDLQLREALLSVHLRLYITKFGTPSLQELVKCAKGREDNAEID